MLDYERVTARLLGCLAASAEKNFRSALLCVSLCAMQKSDQCAPHARRRTIYGVIWMVNLSVASRMTFDRASVSACALIWSAQLPHLERRPVPTTSKCQFSLCRIGRASVPLICSLAFYAFIALLCCPFSERSKNIHAARCNASRNWRALELFRPSPLLLS